MNFQYAEANAIADINTWHCRLGHANFRLCKQTESKVDGMKIRNSITSEIESDCDVCHISKAKRKPFKGKFRKEYHLGDLIHADLTGKISPTSITGAKYYYEWFYR